MVDVLTLTNITMIIVSRVNRIGVFNHPSLFFCPCLGNLSFFSSRARPSPECQKWPERKIRPSPPPPTSFRGRRRERERLRRRMSSRPSPKSSPKRRTLPKTEYHRHRNHERRRWKRMSPTAFSLHAHHHPQNILATIASRASYSASRRHRARRRWRHAPPRAPLDDSMAEAASAKCFDERRYCRRRATNASRDDSETWVRKASVSALISISASPDRLDGKPMGRERRNALIVRRQTQVLNQREALWA